MEKKYTMKEFKEMFDEAQFKALEHLTKTFDETGKEKGMENPMAGFVFNMQNMIAMTELEKYLFGEER